MKNKMVNYTVEALPTLSEEEFRQLKQDAANSETAIDYSDLPEISRAQARHFFPAGLRRFFRTHLMTAVDADILAWLRAKGLDHDLFVNDLLRREMDKEQAAEKHAA